MPLSGFRGKSSAARQKAKETQDQKAVGWSGARKALMLKSLPGVRKLIAVRNKAIKILGIGMLGRDPFAKRSLPENN